MRLNIDVEKQFDKFVNKFGGMKISELIGKSPNFDNADYLFDEYKVIAELKCLEEDKSKDPNIQDKINKKYKEWLDHNIINPLGKGHFRINTSILPTKCQLDLVNILEKPIKKRIIKANKQIRETRKNLGKEHYKGLLLLVNDGNYAVESDLIMFILSRILKSNFSSINQVIYFTVNIIADSPYLDKDTLIWLPSQINNKFLQSLYIGWHRYLESLIGMDIRTFYANEDTDISKIKFVKD